MEWITLIIVTCLTLLLISNKRYRWIYIVCKTIPRDLRALTRFAQLNILLWYWEAKKISVPVIFSKIVKKYPQKTALYFEEEKWSFQQLDDYANRVANYFRGQGYKKGDTIALILENRPEYVGIWMGLGKMGIVTALINTNLTNDPMVHSLNAAKVKGIIYGSDYAKAVNDITGKLSPTISLYELNFGAGGDNPGGTRAVPLRRSLDEASDAPPPAPAVPIHNRDPLLYIYTSGTTGLPKAAVISNQRYYFMVASLYFMTALKIDDIVYNALPLYHSAGGVVGVGQAVLRGVSVVLRKKFSASNFWKDCATYNCTAAQYIGEICRYLLAVPESQMVKHNVQKMLGNGLKPQIWQKFCNRFNIKEIYEFYGATEGNSNLINLDNTSGAVGFVPRYASFLIPVQLIKCDEITGEPIKDNQGFCIPCKIEEPGILIGKINPKKLLNQFTGYADKEESAKKVMHNVFKQGDIYFNSGDILVQDELGYFYFKDRTGDTFRWKGENVATSEVEAVISNVLQLADAVVYGVQIPGTDGRAGMAAIVDPNKNLDLSALAAGVRTNLPSYAQPLFLRVLNEVSMTGTFKLKKRHLQEDGFDIHRIKDDLYFYDAKLRAYIKMTEQIWNDIMSGQIRL